MTIVRTIAVPFRKKMTEHVLCCLKLIPLRGKIYLSHTYHTTLWNLLGCFFENFRQAPRHFYMGAPPGIRYCE